MTCHVHASHRPMPIALHTHHVQPRGMGGPDTASNRVEICPTGHANVHAVLAALVYGKPPPRSSKGERHLAEVGLQMWNDAGRPGNPHAAFGVAHEA